MLPIVTPRYDISLSSGVIERETKLDPNLQTERKKTVTMIGALRTYEGALLCADTEETRGDYRVTVDKLEKRDAGEYEVVIGGAGDVTGLIDGFYEQILFNIKRWRGRMTEEEIYNAIDANLRAYNKSHVKSHLAHWREKEADFIYCIRDKVAQKVYLYKSEGIGLSIVRRWAIIGYEPQLYHHKLDALYDNVFPEQAIRRSRNYNLYLAIYLLGFGEKLFNVVRGEKLIVVTEQKIRVIPPEDVRELKERLDVFEKLLNQILLTAPDTGGESNDEFEGYMSNVMDWVMQKRVSYMSRPVSLVDPMPQPKEPKRQRKYRRRGAVIPAPIVSASEDSD